MLLTQTTVPSPHLNPIPTPRPPTPRVRKTIPRTTPIHAARRRLRAALLTAHVSPAVRRQRQVEAQHAQHHHRLRQDDRLAELLAALDGALVVWSRQRVPPSTTRASQPALRQRVARSGMMKSAYLLWGDSKNNQSRGQGFRGRVSRNGKRRRREEGAELTLLAHVPHVLPIHMSKPPTPRRATNPMPITVIPKRPIPLTIPPRTLMPHAETTPLPLPLPAPLPITLVPLTIPSRHAARIRHIPRLDPPAAPLLAGMRQARPLAGARRPRVAARRLLLESAVVLAAVGRGDAVLVDVGKAPAAGRGAHAVAVAVAGGVVGVACCAGAAG
ncbi:hypothetical protein CCUS01_16444 [Colletotrichum cuscutae]|uniref:Uncharacterized protein n=1 Tax=Colletotrichum cuscutae TaxID=1209917 RepID=A0AAI9V9I4_9PEZI|nr:hypothetical protein CCUS01_16444 [Colletotrichum cuscutae]